jgi:tellurium resistance protein TerD
MNLMIDTGKRESRPSQFGSLRVDTGQKTVHTGNIVLGTPVQTLRQQIRQTPPPIPDSPASKPMKQPNHITDSRGAVPIKMGQKISLNQTLSNISRFLIVLEWHADASGRQPFDLDVSIFMTDSANKTAEEDFIFYNNPVSRCGSIRLKSDDNLGIKECYDETVQFDLSRVPPHIQTLAVTVTIDEADERGQNFGKVSDAYLRVIDPATRKEVLFYQFAEQLSVETAIVVTEIYRHKNEWKINPIGRGFKGGLQALCDNYGIETE